MTKFHAALGVAALASTLISAPVPAQAQSKSIAEANKHHAQQQRAAEQRRQQDNRTVQQANTNSNSRKR